MLAALSRLKIYKHLTLTEKGLLLDTLCAIDRLGGGFFADKEMRIPLSDDQIIRLVGVELGDWLALKDGFLKGGILKARGDGVYCPFLTDSFEIKTDPNDLALAESILAFWNDKGIQKHGRTASLISKVVRLLKKYNYTKAQIEEAITNYDQILRSNEYFWTKKWGLPDFLSRGVDRFATDARPFEVFRQQFSGKKQSILTPRPRREMDIRDLQ